MESKSVNISFAFNSESMILSIKIGDDFGLSSNQLTIETQSLTLGLMDSLKFIHKRRPLKIKSDSALNPIVLAVIIGIMGKVLSAIAVYDYQIKKYIVCTSTAPHFLIGDILD